MTTNNKNFKIKNGLEVQGNSATVNGNDVLTTASNLDSLNDVNTSGATTNDALIYNGTGWEPGAVAAGGNSFSTISTPAGTSPVASSSSDTLTLAAGTGITITGDSTTDTVTIAASGGSGVSQTNGTVTTASTSLNVVRNITLSTSAPSGGNDGDVWMQYV